MRLKRKVALLEERIADLEGQVNSQRIFNCDISIKGDLSKADIDDITSKHKKSLELLHDSNLNQQEESFYRYKEKTFQHYGIDINGKISNTRYSTCKKQQNMLATMGLMQGYINSKKKTRLIIDYDPGFDEALIQVIED